MIFLSNELLFKLGGDRRYAKRPGFNDNGKKIMVDINMYKVTQYPTKKVYQFDVSCNLTCKPLTSFAY